VGDEMGGVAVGSSAAIEEIAAKGSKKNAAIPHNSPIQRTFGLFQSVDRSASQSGLRHSSPGFCPTSREMKIGQELGLAGSARTQGNSYDVIIREFR
jgi:hypothetical protein